MFWSKIIVQCTSKLHQSLLDEGCKYIPTITVGDQQTTKLFKLLKKHNGFFQGKFSEWLCDNMLSKFEDDAEYYYGKLYPVPPNQLLVM